MSSIKTINGFDWLVIVNPNAGRKKGYQDWPIIKSHLEQNSFNYFEVFTESPGHAIDISREYIEHGVKKIIVIGGDGTMNEVINGLFRQSKFPTTSVVLGMITVGTGNDWGRMFNIPSGYAEAIETIKAGNIFVQDAGIVSYRNGNRNGKSREDRYFVNIAGLGFDALVTRKTNRLKEKGRGGTLLYFLNIFSSLLNYRFVNAMFSIDGKAYQNEIFSMNIGIGKYSGGGMMQVPGAIPDDGLFDLTVIKRLSKTNVVLSLHRLYKGTIHLHPRVETYSGKSITIDSDTVIHLETDGESLGHTPIEFNIIPKSVKVISGQAV
jgi:YegS/Rv2252/BmrU family lipid kinase